MDKAKNLQEVFSGRIFQIPDYQRGYAWGERQCQDLIEDLEFLAPGREHFTGTLVLHQADGDGAFTDAEGRSYTLFHIVDGQQRLTSVVLLLDAICRELQAIDKFRVLADGLRKTYIVTADMNGELMAKLALNEDCRDFFCETILEQKPAVLGPTIRSHQLLVDAKSQFRDYLHRKRDELGPDYGDWLVSLRGRITNQLTVLIHELGAEADAGVVFETTNNRGTDLNELDKVKNYLMYLSSKLDLPAEHDLARSVNAAWSHIYKHLMAAGLTKPDDEDQLLRAHWLMRYDYQPRNWAQSRSIKAKFNLKDYQGRHAELLADLRSYVDTLRNAATAYCEIHNPTGQGSFSILGKDSELRSRVVRAAEKLPRLGAVAPFLPLLIGVRLTTPSDGEKYLEFIELCESFAFRLFRWMGLPAQTGRNALFKLGYELFNARRTPKDVLDEVRGLLMRYCPDQKFLALLQATGEDWYRWSGIKYFLYEYEEHLARKVGQEVRMPWSYAEENPNTIEHILPQTPSATGYWADQFTDEMLQRYTNDIGNLCLTFDNTWLGNKSFTDKLGVGRTDGKGYSNSKLFDEHGISHHRNWTEKELLERRREIEQWAVTRWTVLMPVAKPSQGQTLEWIEELAERNGVADDLRRLMGAARKWGILLRAHPQCIVFAPSYNGRLALFTVWPDPGKLRVGIWPDETFPLRDRFLEILGPVREVYLSDASLDEFIKALDRVFTPDVKS